MRDSATLTLVARFVMGRESRTKCDDFRNALNEIVSRYSRQAVDISMDSETFYRDPDTGHLMMPGSKRPDGTWRKPRRIKEGYTPQEEVPLYESKGKQWAKAKAETEHVPVGLSKAILNMKIDTFDSRSLQPAYHIPGLNTEPTSSSTSTSSKKKNKSKAVNHANPPLSPPGMATPTATPAVATDPNKKLRNLRKKLRDIEALEERLAQGQIENPEPEQLEKVGRKSQVQEEISTLEKQLNIV